MDYQITYNILAMVGLIIIYIAYWKEEKKNKYYLAMAEAATELYIAEKIKNGGRNE